MSLSGQMLSFLAVAVVYIGFTFLWGWWKGKQNDETANGESVHDTSNSRGGDV